MNATNTINLNRLAYFAAVADTGSFTAAADRLGITKAVVSQQVNRLEEDLKATLLIRTTRRVTLTDAGRLFHARCLIVLTEAHDAIQQLAETNVQPTGVLRIAAPNDYGTRVIAPVAAQFARQYPACRVDLMLSDAKTDLIAAQIDLSIRAGWLTDSSLQARKIGTFRQWLVASPELACRIAAKEPDDLAPHPFIANGSFREPLVWHFSRNDFERRTVRMTEAMRIDSTPAIMAASIAGGGLAVLPDFMAADALRSGDLVHLLPDWTLPAAGIHAVYPASRFRPSKVTAFVSLLIEHM